MSIEKKFQKKTQREHILLRPDTYIGSSKEITEPIWTFNHKSNKMEYNDLTYVPGLYQIFDEVLVNAYDHSVNDKTVKNISIVIDKDSGTIKVKNDGSGIPVVKHKALGMYIPEMIFGHLLTSTNYDDSQKRVSGGRNGYGAKLTNIFSSEFTIETVDSKNKLKYTQKWSNNMSKVGKPNIKPYSGKSYTSVTFKPDFNKFGISNLNLPNYKIMERRVYDLSACTRKDVSVFFNNTKIPFKLFDDYVKLYLDDDTKRFHYMDNENNMLWEMVVAVNDDYSSFMQVSFVNGISTERGGKHVDYVIEQIVRKLIDHIKRNAKGKNKDIVNKIRYESVKNKLWLFLKSVIYNPAFTSQTKNILSTEPKEFGKTFTVPDRLIEKLAKTDIVNDILSFTRFKEESKDIKGKEGKKKSTVRGIPKLEDANWAGGPKSSQCTLILTEGESAKAFAISGLSIIGRDKYGVFPLKGKLLNVREASRSQLTNNQEVINLKQIIGLQEKKKYNSPSELRYGHIMLLTDSDEDGSHIKGLIMNLFEYLWPELLSFPDFLVSLATPVRKAFKGNNTLTFFTEREYNNWKKKQSQQDLVKWRIKHYKGLGTSTSTEAKESFKDIDDKIISYSYKGNEDHNAILLAFDKTKIEQRKKWLKDFNTKDFITSIKSPNTSKSDIISKRISIKDFINKEFIHFSIEDNVRSIPNIIDGFKPSQRKVLFSCLKKNLVNEMKVFQLAGYVAETSAYHHGDASLNSTIISMAQNYLGSNNINLLYPAGQFGTRILGGKDHASPRYIFTRLENITKTIFNSLDSPLLDYIEDDGLLVEPVYYYPIIPMVLVNGAEGIGTGYSTSIPSYNPLDLISILISLLNESTSRGTSRGTSSRSTSSSKSTSSKKTSSKRKSSKRKSSKRKSSKRFSSKSIKITSNKLKPWYKGFKGDIKKSDDDGFYITRGVITKLADNKLEISELPIGQWTTPYKEYLESLTDTGIKLKSSKTGKDSKDEGIIKSFSVHHTDKDVKFIVKLKDGININKLDLYKVFKLEKRLSINNMYLFDSNSKLRLYKNVEEIIKEFYHVRLEMYGKRRKHLIDIIQRESLIMKSKANFINDVINKKIKVFREPESRVVQQLTNAKYPKIDNSYDYLTSLSINKFSKEKIEEIENKLKIKLQELRKLSSKSDKDLWLEDLLKLQSILQS